MKIPSILHSVSSSIRILRFGHGGRHRPKHRKKDGVFWTRMEERGRRRRDSSAEKERDSRASRAFESVLFGGAAGVRRGFNMDFYISNESSCDDLSISVNIKSP